MKFNNLTSRSHFNFYFFMFPFCLLLQSVASTITVDSDVSNSDAAFDINYDGIVGRKDTITAQGDGVFCQLKVGSQTKQLSVKEPTTIDSLTVTILSETHDDTLIIKFNVNNTGNESQTFSIGTYSDISFYDDNTRKDRVNPVDSNTFYIDNPQFDTIRLYYHLESTDDYAGPNKHWFGESVDPYAGEKIYYDNIQSGQNTFQGDVAISYSFNDITVGANEVKTLGVKMEFKKGEPQIVIQNPDQIIYETEGTISFPNITVQNSEKGTVKIDYKGKNIKSVPYTSAFSQSVDVKLDNTFVYSANKYCVDIYADAEKKTETEQFCFSIVNKPQISDIKITQTIGTKKATVTGTVTDKDIGKILYLYVDVDDAAQGSSVSQLKSNGNTLQINSEITVPNRKKTVKYVAWVSTDGFSTETSSDSVNAKSNIERVTFTFADPTMNLKFPDSKSFPRNKKIQINGTATSDDEITLKFFVDDKELRDTKTVQSGQVDIDFEIPEDTKLGKHVLKVTATDKRGTQGKDKNEFEFTVENAKPVIQEVSLDKLSVVAGEKVKVKGKVFDPDKHSKIKITVKYDNVESSTEVTSDGTAQEFEVVLTTKDVDSNKQFDVSIESNDGTDSYVYQPKPKLTVEAKPIPTKSPTQMPSAEGNPSDDPNQRKHTVDPNAQNNNKTTYIIVGVVVACVVVAVIIVAIILILKKKNNISPTEGGYQKDEQVEP